MDNRYPRLEINLSRLRQNVADLAEKCAARGVRLIGVESDLIGLPEAARAFDEGGAAMIVSSRLEQLEDAVAAGIKKPMVLARVPAISEAAEVIRITDVSFNSELKVIEALDREAKAQGRLHKVILMIDLGDSREGYRDKEEMLEAAVYVENELTNVRVAGIGTNSEPCGSITSEQEILRETAGIAKDVERRIGRELEFISVGGVIFGLGADEFRRADVSELHRGVFRLRAEVIEVKDKPSYPVGTIAVDAFGHTPEFADRGIRRRAILAAGKVDYGEPSELIPQEDGVEVLGASSDHTIVDVGDAARIYKVGDVMGFDVRYANIIYALNSKNVKIVFV